MDENERYQQIDRPFYQEQIALLLPPVVLDFHTHLWTGDHIKIRPAESLAPGAQYMVFEETYNSEQLLADLALIYPDRECSAVCFGWPSPMGILPANNGYVAAVGKDPCLYPLIMAGNNMQSPEELRQLVADGGFFGYKVFMDWVGNDYGEVTIEDMLGKYERSLANELGLVILLHVPRDRRLADHVVQQGVQTLSRECPNASIVLAHCGRAYLPDEMAQAVDSVQNCSNVYFDTAMVMEPTVMQMAMEKLGPSRILYATDLPIARMRGRRVYVMDHWVDLVLEGYDASAYRVGFDNMHATFMVYEIVLAIHRAAELSGLSKQEENSIFYDNGMRVLNRVMDGERLKAKSKSL